MSQPLTMKSVLENLQSTVHDLLDLRGPDMPGLVIEDLPVQYRDMGARSWRITFELLPLSRNRVVEDDESEDEADDEEEVAPSPTE